MSVPSIEFLASHGIIVSRREVITVPNEILTSRGVVTEGTEEIIRDYFSPLMSREDERKKYWFYNPTGSDWGENPHNPFEKGE
jgi:hypothetical protein